jgi:cysteine dioxygenase
LNSNKHTSEKFQSFNELITALSEGERNTFNHIIHSIEIPIEDFEVYTSWSKECYTRNCIINNEKFELILICWKEGDQTSIHDHDGEECWVKVIAGEFKETIYKLNDLEELDIVKSSISKKNQITYMKDFMGFHRLENVSKKRSMSLHLYAKPIRKCRMYDEETKTLINKNLGYTTIA